MKKLLLMFGIFAGLSLAAVSCGAEEAKADDAKTEASAEGDEKECTKDGKCCKKGEKCAKGDKCCKKGGKECTKDADAEGKCAGKCGEGKCADHAGDAKCGAESDSTHKCGEEHEH
ncbi:MAG: hypothetical protein ACI9N1_000200 [Flavobacteriales bacterium]|jgi:hypothetical protein